MPRLMTDFVEEIQIKFEIEPPVLAQYSIRSWNRFADEGHGWRCSVIEGRAALLRRGLRAWILSAPISERRKCGRHNGRQYGFSHCKRFRRRDARSDGAGRDVAGAGRSTDVAGRRCLVL